MAFSLVAAVRERVWFCTVRGAKPWERPTRGDVRERDQGGHTIWYDEPALLEVRRPCTRLVWCWVGPALLLDAAVSLGARCLQHARFCSRLPACLGSNCCMHRMDSAAPQGACSYQHCTVGGRRLLRLRRPCQAVPCASNMRLLGVFTLLLALTASGSARPSRQGPASQGSTRAAGHRGALEAAHPMRGRRPEPAAHRAPQRHNRACVWRAARCGRRAGAPASSWLGSPCILTHGPRPAGAVCCPGMATLPCAVWALCGHALLAFGPGHTQPACSQTSMLHAAQACPSVPHSADWAARFCACAVGTPPMRAQPVSLRHDCQQMLMVKP